MKWEIRKLVQISAVSSDKVALIICLKTAGKLLDCNELKKINMKPYSHLTK